MKKTLVIIKPDAVKAGHIGDIITFLGQNASHN